MLQDSTLGFYMEEPLSCFWYSGTLLENNRKVKKALSLFLDDTGWLTEKFPEKILKKVKYITFSIWLFFFFFAFHTVAVETFYGHGCHV